MGLQLSHHANAIVTGSGSGIGRAFALELAKRHSKVVCSDINLANAQQTASMINTQYPNSAIAIGCDVTQINDVEALAVQAKAWFAGSPINLVINNAGVGMGGKAIGEYTLEDWRWVIDINMWGVIHGCHVFVPLLKQAPHAGIINVASSAAFCSAPKMSAYNVSKAGVLALTETLAAELQGSNFHVTALCPTVVKTNIFNDGRLYIKNRKWLDRVIKWTGMRAETVAIAALNGLDENKLYVLPQQDARLLWRTKRFLPRSYNKLSALLSKVV